MRQRNRWIVNKRHLGNGRCCASRAGRAPGKRKREREVCFSRKMINHRSGRRLKSDGWWWVNWYKSAMHDTLVGAQRFNEWSKRENWDIRNSRQLTYLVCRSPQSLRIWPLWADSYLPWGRARWSWRNRASCCESARCNTRKVPLVITGMWIRMRLLTMDMTGRWRTAWKGSWVCSPCSDLRTDCPTFERPRCRMMLDRHLQQ